MRYIEAELPDGRILEFPEGTDRAVIQAKVKEYMGVPQGGRGNDLSSTLAKIDSMKVEGDDRYDPSGSSSRYLLEQGATGAANLLGLGVDTMGNLANLGIAGYGFAKGELTGSADLPEPIDLSKQVGSSQWIKDRIIPQRLKPTGRVDEIAGRIVRDATGAALPAAGFARAAANPIASLAAAGGLSALASLGGEAGRSVAPEGYENVGDFAGVLAGGMAAPGFIANRVDAINNLRSVNAQSKLNSAADNYAQEQILTGVKTYPGAAQNLDDALRMEQEIPGFKARIGQASGVPSLLDMERRVATAGPEQFNKRTLQDQAQQAAIRAEAERRLPLLAGKNDVGDMLAATQSQRRDLADALPIAQADEIGQTLRASRNSLKGRYDVIASEKFRAPAEEASKLNVKIDPGGIVEKANALRQNPIVQFDATNSPAILSKIDDIGRLRDPGSLLVTPGGKPIREMLPRKIGFDDLTGLRQAVNQDIAREAGSMNPNARQRLRGLIDLKNEIDAAAMQAPESVRKLYSDASNWYRDVYAPKFLRGVNLKQSMKDITGEARISDEKLAGQYFKPMGGTSMDRFLKLYSESPQAMNKMETHVLDTYRKMVVKDGVIDQRKHDQFINNYRDPLKRLPEIEGRIKSVSVASSLLAERELQLANAQKILSQGELAVLKYDALPESGLDPKKMNAFLSQNGATFSETVGSIYGKQTAQDHLENLKKIAKAAEIAERGALPPAASPKQDISPMSMQGAVGFTGRTVFSMLRAITTGRTSPHDMGYTLGAQSISHRIGKALIAAEERAISDPETAQLIAQSIKLNPNTPQGKGAFTDLLSKGGFYITGKKDMGAFESVWQSLKTGSNFFVGGNKWPEYIGHRSPQLAIDGARQGTEAAQE